MRKQTCLYSQIGLLTSILHPLERSLADRSTLFILIELHCVAPFGLQPYIGFGKRLLKTMKTKKSHF